MTTSSEDAKRFVGRGGLKLDYALDRFGIDVTGKRAADFGCNVGGFTDCLLQRGAAMVYAIDSGYGMLDYKLRCDERVNVMERTNVLHCTPPPGGVDLVVIDVGWTPQARILPVAMQWIAGHPDGCIVSLIKPHYERSASDRSKHADRGGILDREQAQETFEIVLDQLARAGLKAVQTIESPIVGGRGKGKRGNVEFLSLFRP